MGFRNTNSFRIETALNSLRNRPDFQFQLMDLAFPAVRFANCMGSREWPRDRQRNDSIRSRALRLLADLHSGEDCPNRAGWRRSRRRRLKSAGLGTGASLRSPQPPTHPITASGESWCASASPIFSKSARLGQSYRKLLIWRSSGSSFVIRRETQASASPQRKCGARCLFFGTRIRELCGACTFCGKTR
jgi:hypothetical protein